MHTADDSAPAGNWRFKLGLLIFALAFALWLLLPLAAALDVATTRIAAMTGAIFIANKVMLLACIGIMGKPGFQQLKSLVFGYVKGLAPSPTVGPLRHAIGLVMFFLPILTAMLEPYIDHFWPTLRPNLWQVQLLGDVMLLAGFFVLGGEFWNKVHALFIRTARVVDDRAPAKSAGL